MTGRRNVTGGLVLLALGLAAGLGMSLYAFAPLVTPPPALAHYDDLPRRLIRLAHIAAIMLPLINIVLGPWLDRVSLSGCTRQSASWLLLLGAAGLPLSLILEALVPPVIVLHLPALPALGFTLAVVLVAVGACGTDFSKEEAHVIHHRRGVARDRDRGQILQETGRQP